MVEEPRIAWLNPGEHRGTSVDRVPGSLLPEFVLRMRAAHTEVGK